MKIKRNIQKRKILSILFIIISIYLFITFLVYIIFKLLIIPNPYIIYREGYPPYKTHYSGSAFNIEGIGCYGGDNYKIGFYKDLKYIDRPDCINARDKNCISERQCYGLKFEKEYKNHINFYNVISKKNIDFYTNAIITSCLGISRGRNVCLMD